jgi:hypothetical protein
MDRIDSGVEHMAKETASVASMRGDFMRTMRKMIAVSAIGPSSLRGQQAGTIAAVQSELEKIDLGRFARQRSEKAFLRHLDSETQRLQQTMPGLAWGAARKALNIFLRDCLNNRWIEEKYQLSNIEAWLEIALDSYTGNGLRAAFPSLPRWPRLKHLTPQQSADYQEAARLHARNKRIDRVHLDMYLWLQERSS